MLVSISLKKWKKMQVLTEINVPKSFKKSPVCILPSKGNEFLFFCFLKIRKFHGLLFQPESHFPNSSKKKKNETLTLKTVSLKEIYWKNCCVPKFKKKKIFRIPTKIHILVPTKIKRWNVKFVKINKSKKKNILQFLTKKNKKIFDFLASWLKKKKKIKR